MAEAAAGGGVSLRVGGAAGIEALYLHSEDGDLFAGTGVRSYEGTPSGQTGTHHRCGHLARNVVGDLEGEVFVGADITGVSTLGDCSVGVGGIVGILSTLADSFNASMDAVTYRLGEGSSSRCPTCNSCIPSRPKSEHRHQHGLQPSPW